MTARMSSVLFVFFSVTLRFPISTADTLTGFICVVY